MLNFENVLKTMKSYGYHLDNLVSNYELSENTKIDNNTLYYKTITEGLLCLCNSKLGLNQQISSDNLKSLGLMYDVSRGPVNTIDDLKDQFVKASLLGYNYIMLYTEDLFEIDVDNFGYLRGKYSSKEIKELDLFAQSIGLELVPCIQTLGHFENFLKWDKDNIYKDSDNVINIYSEYTINVLHKILDFCSENFQTNKIHIGMDEATDLGTGNLLRQFGYHTQAELYLSHLSHIYNYCLELNYEEVIIWSDMLFTLDSRGKELYSNDVNYNLSNDIKSLDKLKLCYWNYWSNNINDHTDLLKVHYNFIDPIKIICAGGVNQWAQLTYLPKSIDSFNALLQTMKKENLNNLLLTMWFDDAGYTNFNTTEYGIYERCKLIFDITDDKNLLYEYVYQTDFASYKAIISIYDSPLDYPRILWDDPIKQTYLKTKNLCIEELENSLICCDVSEKFIYTKHLVNFAIKKSILSLKLRSNTVKIDDINELKFLLSKVNKEFRKYWLSHYKYYSMDLIQARFAILGDRLNEIETRINNNESFVELQEIQDVKTTESFNDVFYQTNYRW